MGAQKNGDGGTVYSLYNLANKRASNYGKCGSLGAGSCSTDKVAQSTSGSVSVADLNIVVADALNYGTSGPTAAAVTNIRDSINTINAQAAQRYIARISLDANVPGNGMGGSAQRIKVADPAASTVANTANAANGKIPTACGAGVYYEQRAENGNPAAASNLPVPANIPGAGNTVGSGQNKAQAPATNYAVAGPAVNAQCGTTANATGTVASNTALVRTVMNPVTMTAGTTGAQPYKLVGAALGTAATRGQNTNSGADYTKIAPIGCIDASVAFLETKIYSTMVAVTVGGVTTAQTAGRHMVIKPCDPEGYAGVSKNTNTLAQNLGLYHVGGGLLGPLLALPPGLPPPTVIRCLRTVATNQLPSPQLPLTLPRPRSALCKQPRSTGCGTLSWPLS